MDRVILYIVFFLCINSGVASAENEVIGSCQNYIDKYSSNIPKYFIGKLNKFDFHDFGKVIKGIKKGDMSCFQVGGILLNSKKHTFGAYTSDLSNAFGSLVNNKPKLFNKYYGAFSFTDESMVRIFNVNVDKVNHFKKTEILADIKIRRNYIQKHLDNNFESKLNYVDTLDYLNDLSLRKLEVFKKDGSRIVYSSTYPYLDSEKKYKLSNLIDADNTSAWCVDYHDVRIDKDNRLRPLIELTIYKNGIKCENKNTENKCYVKGVDFSISPGYQKNTTVFKNNVRLRSIGVNVEHKYGIPKYNKIEIQFDDALITKNHYFPVDKYLNSYDQLYIWIYADSVFNGKKYNDLCISSLDIDLK